ncbi:hypothetical protein TNCT_703301 [Trichonephila clavata]|uniref:Uncharacterized protein n=1 Tax=Trichonephila clavata TaxID=2740835 RepID=A0A8X6KPX1_TRICU|nr:hypothetical protein TNCT_703301 [Trichonephila clavata]
MQALLVHDSYNKDFNIDSAIHSILESVKSNTSLLKCLLCPSSPQQQKFAQHQFNSLQERSRVRNLCSKLRMGTTRGRCSQARWKVRRGIITGEDIAGKERIVSLNENWPKFFTCMGVWMEIYEARHGRISNYSQTDVSETEFYLDNGIANNTRQVFSIANSLHHSRRENYATSI